MSDKNETKMSGANYNEQSIIEKCQAGDMLEFGKVYDFYVRKIYNFIYYKTMHKETAEDLTSLTFTKAISGIKNFRFDRGTFSAWLYTIARNSVKDHYRAQKPEAALEDIYDLAADDDPLVDAGNKIIFEKVKRYLGKLESEQREIVVMRLWDGLAFREIAETLGLSEANSKMIFYRTMARLREDLALLIIYLILLVI